MQLVDAHGIDFKLSGGGGIAASCRPLKSDISKDGKSGKMNQMTLKIYSLQSEVKHTTPRSWRTAKNL